MWYVIDSIVCRLVEKHYTSFVDSLHQDSKRKTKETSYLPTDHRLLKALN